MVIFILAAVSVRQASAARDTADRLAPVQGAIERLQLLYVDQESGLRGYLLTGQQPFLDPYLAAVPVIAQEQDHLRSALGNAPAAEATFAAYQDWRDQAAARMIQFRRDGSIDAASELAAQGVGKTRFDLLRNRIDALRSEVQAAVEQAKAAADAARWRVTAAFLIGGALALGAGLVALVTVRRGVITPLDQLVDDVTAVATGDTAHPVRSDGPAELATVGSAVAAMRDQLAEHAQRRLVEEKHLAQIQQSDRIAHEIADDVLVEMPSITMRLSSLAVQHTSLATPLLELVGRLDRTITKTRAAAYSAPGPHDPEHDDRGVYGAEP